MTRTRRTLEQKQELINKYEALRADGVRADVAAKQLGFRRKDVYPWRIQLKETPAKVVTYTASKPAKITRTYTKNAKTPLHAPLALVIGTPDQLNNFLKGYTAQ